MVGSDGFAQSLLANTSARAGCGHGCSNSSAAPWGAAEVFPQAPALAPLPRKAPVAAVVPVLVPNRDSRCRSGSTSPMGKRQPSPSLGPGTAGQGAAGTRHALTGVELPCDGDAADLRVAEPQEEGPVGLVDEQVVRLLLVDEAQDGPRQSGGVRAGGSGPGSAGQGGSYPSFQCGFRCFFSTSMTPSNHCQKV